MIGSGIDVEPIKKKLAPVSQAEWNKSGREKTFEALRQTKSLMLIYDENFRHYNPTYQGIYSKFEVELKPLLYTRAYRQWLLITQMSSYSYTDSIK